MPKNTNSKKALSKSLLRNAIEKLRHDAVANTRSSVKSNKQSS
jgi:hypothetical protein